MTNLIIESESPPDAVIADAERIADGTVAKSVEVEDAVDDQWFIRVEGPAGDYGDVYEMSEEEFDNLCETTREITQGPVSAFKTYYGVGPSNDKYLIRIEY